MLDESHVLIRAAYLAVHDQPKSCFVVLGETLQRILEAPETERTADAVVIPVFIGRDVASFHRVDNRLDVRRRYRRGNGKGGRAIGGKSNRVCGSSSGDPKRGGVELLMHKGIKIARRIVLQDFHDGLPHVELRQGFEKAGIRNAETTLAHRERALQNGVLTLRYRVGFSQCTRCTGHHRHRIPRESLTGARYFAPRVFDIGKLTEFGHGLHAHSQIFTQIERGIEAPQTVCNEQLTCHD